MKYLGVGSGATVTTITVGTGTCKIADDARCIDLTYSVSIIAGDVYITCIINSHAHRLVQPRCSGSNTICISGCSVSGKSGNYPGGIYFADTHVCFVSNIKIPTTVNGYPI